MAEQKLTLYWLPASQPSRTLKTALLLAKLPHEEKFVDITKGEHKTPEFTKINPKQSIPCITDGDFPLGESNAILRYLAATRDIPEHLYPKDPKVRAQVDVWMDFAQNNLRVALANVLRQYLAKVFGGPEKDDHLVAFFMKGIASPLSYLEKSLEGKKYIVGDAISFADLQLFHELTTAQMCKLDIKEYKNIAAYQEHLLGAHPEIKQVNDMFASTLEGLYAAMGI